MKRIRYAIVLIGLLQILSCNNSDSKRIELKITPDSSIENGMSKFEPRIQSINNNIFSEFEIQLIRKDGYFIVRLPSDFAEIEEYKRMISPQEDIDIYISLAGDTSNYFLISKNVLSVNTDDDLLIIELDREGLNKVLELTKNNSKEDLNFVFKNEVFLNAKSSEYTIDKELVINCNYLPRHKIQDIEHILQIKQPLFAEIEEIER